MHLKIVAISGAMLALAACGTVPGEQANTGSAGSGQSTSGQQAAGGNGGNGQSSQVQAVETRSLKQLQAELAEAAGDSVFFDFDQHGLKAEGRQTLEAQAKWLQANPGVTLTIEGHCDERGTREYNLALGARRAQAAKNYLVALGIDESRLATISYGKEKPFAVGSNDAAWALNRRGFSRVNQ